MLVFASASKAVTAAAAVAVETKVTAERKYLVNMMITVEEN